MVERLIRRVVGLLVVLALAGVASPAHAVDGPLDPKAVPEPLKPWIGWALHARPDALCPTLHGLGGGIAQCAWPARLDLVLDEKRGTFKQTWHLDARRFVPLPGNDKRWPLDVTVDGHQTGSIVIPREGVPTVELDPGDHTVAGTFAWDSLPESLQIPPQTALLGLVLRGKAIDQPNRDAKGTLWLQKTLAADEGERLDFVVHRRVVDDVPLLLTTRIVLNVAGRNREVLLGKTLPAGFVPMAIDSQLPARVEPDTRLRVQVRPGTWTIEVVARSEAPVREIRRPAPDGPWREGEEVWVFEAKQNLRLVDVQGVSAIDPQQTSLPDEWKRLPAYPLGLKDVMLLAEKRRGDAEPPPDHLTIDRTMWLDFDGKGLTVSDTLTGNLRRASRLEMAPPTVLGRVAIGGKDQFITHLEGDKVKMGVEVRQGELSVTADSRVIADPSDLPAVGWNHDFHAVSGTLHLPPGFRLLHASGVDDVPSTWIKHWTLLEIFLVLVLGVGVWRLFGLGWGLVALVTFSMTFPESGAPKYVFIFVLVVEALVRAIAAAERKAAASAAALGGALPPTNPTSVPPLNSVPPGVPRGLVVAKLGARMVRAFAALVLVLLTIPFLVDHVRHGLFPALAVEQGGEGDVDMADGLLARKLDRAGAAAPVAGKAVEAPAPTPAQPAEPKAEGRDEDGEKDRSKNEGKKDALEKQAAPQDKGAESTVNRTPLRGGGKLGPAGTATGSSWSSDYRQFNAMVYDPSAMVQTGPGRPRWSFTRVPLHWSGPVEKTQRLHLYLLTPTMNAVLAVARVVLLILLVMCLVPVRPRRDRRGGKSVLSFASLGLIALATLLVPGIASAQTVPSKEVLDELASRLLEKPSCSPTCASSSRMLIDARASTLRLRVEIEAAAATAVPLPGSAQWAPETVLLDGRPAKSLLRTEDGKVWLAVEKGSHQATVEGPLPDRELVHLALPLKPHRVEVQAEGWRVEGIHEDGLADDNLQLTRIRGGTGEAGMDPGVLPSFVRVERTILIGLDWQVATRVVRLSPVGTAIVLEVPLLKGESVTTADLRVSAGKVQLNMAPQTREVSWKSVLDQKSPLLLSAPKSVAWTEQWRLDMSPIWHAELSGVPVVHAEPGASLPEWRPWPGESTTIHVSRPDGVVGSTLTIDESTYALRPGVRATDATLTLQLRSSRGAQHAITLPEGAQLESVTINGASSPIRQEGRKVTLPVSPGSQSVAIQWRMPARIEMVFSVPEVDLGAPSVNATTTVTLPEGRWVLGLRGPELGPVVLFWSLLLVVLTVAVVIGAMRRTPLSTWQWMLLVVGLSQVDVLAAAVVVGWLHLLAWREQSAIGRFAFNVRQLAIVFVSFVAMIILLIAVHHGLLGHPDMQVRGNNSSVGDLRWFTDRSEPTLGGPTVVSTSMFVYRGLMLAWALWLALSVVKWLRWGFSAFAAGGFWRRRPPPPPRPMSPHRTPAHPDMPPFPPPPPPGFPPPEGNTPPATG